MIVNKGRLFSDVDNPEQRLSLNDFLIQIKKPVSALENMLKVQPTNQALADAVAVVGEVFQIALKQTLQDLEKNKTNPQQPNDHAQEEINGTKLRK